MGVGPAPRQKLYPIVFPWHTILRRGAPWGEAQGADCDLTEREAAFQSVPVGGSLE